MRWSTLIGALAAIETGITGKLLFMTAIVTVFNIVA
jgi:hypothetical protein